MKKSQILAALALAFALGVVAPVVSTTNTVSAYTAADPTAKPPVKGSATEADVKNAIAAIEANPTYKNMSALKTVLDELDKGVNSKYGNLADDNTIYNLLPNAINALASAEQTSTNGGQVKAFTDAKAELGKQLDDKDITLSQYAEGFVKLAKATTYYNVLAPVFEAYGNGTTTYNKDAFVTAVLNFNAAIKASQNYPVLDINTATFNPGAVVGSVARAFNDEMKTVYGSATTVNYSSYKTIYDNASKVEKSVEKYNLGYNALTDALKANGVLNSDGKIQLAKLEAGTATGMTIKNVTLAQLKGLTDNPSYSEYAAWMTASTPLNIHDTIKNAKAGILPVDSYDNYAAIINLATAYARVTGNNTQTVQEIAATLVGYKAPVANATVTSKDGVVSVTGQFDATKVQVISNKSDKKVAAFGDSKYAMWDIYMADKDGKKVDVQGSVMVSIKVPAGYDAAKSSVYFVNENGKVEKLAAKLENGALNFTVSHFSLYAIVEDNGKNFGIGAPDTGIVANTENSASTTVAMVAGIATALTAAGAGVVAYRNARRSTRK